MERIVEIVPREEWEVEEGEGRGRRADQEICCCATRRERGESE